MELNSNIDPHRTENFFFNFTPLIDYGLIKKYSEYFKKAYKHELIYDKKRGKHTKK